MRYKNRIYTGYKDINKKKIYEWDILEEITAMTYFGHPRFVVLPKKKGKYGFYSQGSVYEKIGCLPDNRNLIGNLMIERIL